MSEVKNNKHKIVKFLCRNHVDFICCQVKESRQAVNQISHMVEINNDDDDMQKFSWSGDPVGSKTAPPECLWRICDRLRSSPSPPVSSGISWSVRETELSSQSTEKGVADTPSIVRSNSGYSVSSFFKGETGSGHVTHKQSGVGHMTDVESATLQEKLKEALLRRTSCPSVKVSLHSE